ncbi:hypothetical protein [Terrabacter sp. MAHUQ-38]|uniref:hypothetical protein n=1 Tax=unclassified Terrabacter TaxID=2630222 RepID=UPI00165D80E8|nr:hypothetical protein [Terrabacter sp. MAHUQ-38]MBC9824140.1 hypothetical protein [Terrabacter sp. MAHUQ-38]
MTNQPGFPVAPGAGLAAMAMSQGDDPELPSDEESPTADWPAQEDEDNGVPVGGGRCGGGPSPGSR